RAGAVRLGDRPPRVVVHVRGRGDSGRLDLLELLALIGGRAGYAAVARCGVDDLFVGRVVAPGRPVRGVDAALEVALVVDREIRVPARTDLARDPPVTVVAEAGDQLGAVVEGDELVVGLTRVGPVIVAEGEPARGTDRARLVVPSRLKRVRRDHLI